MNPISAEKPGHDPLLHHCETADGKPFDVYDTADTKGVWIGLNSPDRCLCLVSRKLPDGNVQTYFGLQDGSVPGEFRAAISVNDDGSYTVQLADGSGVRKYDLDELVRHTKSLPPRAV